MVLAGAALQRGVAYGILLRIAGVLDVLPEEKKGEGVAAVGETASQDSPTELLLVPQLILHPVALLRGPDGLHGAVRAVKRPVKGIPLGALQVHPLREGVQCAGGCGQGGEEAGAHRVCGGPVSGQGLLLRGGDAPGRRGVQCAGLRRHQALPPHRAGRGAGHHRPGDRRGHPGAAGGI